MSPRTSGLAEPEDTDQSVPLPVAAAAPGPQPAAVRRVLLVDPAPAVLWHLRDAIPADVHVTTSSAFDDARRRLASEPPHLLVTNVQLKAFNGLHLVYLAAAAAVATRSLVYARAHDLVLAREAQAAGAFYESFDGLLYALPAYVLATLPERDRRQASRAPRRHVPRGGRRAVDLAALG
jgi:DNA-binding NtrC family response regulator